MLDSIFGAFSKLGDAKQAPLHQSGGSPARPHFDLNEAVRQFKGKRIIITGATGTVGSIVTKRLIKAGAHIAIFYHKRDKIANILQEFPLQVYSNLKELKCDLANPIEIQRRFREAVLFLKGIDCLITCHGVVTRKSINIATIRDFDQAIYVVTNLNVRSVFHLLGMSTPFLKDSGGSVVVLSSANGEHPTPGALTECVSYSMLNMLVKSAAIQLANFDVRVNAVAPYLIDSDHRANKKGMNLTAQENNQLLNKQAEHMPLNKMPLTSEEVAESIMWLASDDSSFVTGEILNIDGGISLAKPNYKQWIEESETQSQGQLYNLSFVTQKK